MTDDPTPEDSAVQQEGKLLTNVNALKKEGDKRTDDLTDDEWAAQQTWIKIQPGFFEDLKSERDESNPDNPTREDLVFLLQSMLKHQTEIEALEVCISSYMKIVIFFSFQKSLSLPENYSCCSFIYFYS